MTALRDAHVLITGGASGIGRLLALGARAQGARVTLLDRDRAGLARVRDELAQDGGDAAQFAVDLCDRPAVQAVAAQVLASRGPVDILINNAGVVTGATLLECTDAAIERTFQVNALALFWTVRAFLPAMIAQGRGHVVTIASAAGLGGTSRLTDYCASKFAAVAGPPHPHHRRLPLVHRHRHVPGGEDPLAAAAAHPAAGARGPADPGRRARQPQAPGHAQVRHGGAAGADPAPGTVRRGDAVLRGGPEHG
jgi:nucleoside-diphosphate-sugar epimerase